MNFLIVEDLNIMRRVIVNALKSFDYDLQIFEANDGLEALEKLEKEDIDLVITDWYMPNLDGLGLIKHIRSDDKLKDIPVIMLTTRGSKEDVLTAYKVSVNGYIVKPFAPEVLKEKIEDVINPYKTYTVD